MERKIKNAMVAVKEMSIIFIGGVALATSFYAYFTITSIYFPSEDCIMTYLLYPLFILPMFHFFHFIAYLHRFFTKGDCQDLNHFVNKATRYIILGLCVYQLVFIYLVPSHQPPSSPPPTSIISPAVTGSCLKNSDVCRNLANTPDFYATFHRPILQACCVPKRYDVWDLAIKGHEQLNGNETGNVAANRCMEVYVDNIRKTSELAGRASIPFEVIVILIIIFLMPGKRATRAAIAS